MENETRIERKALVEDLAPVLEALGEMGASRMGVLNRAETKLFLAACDFLSWVEDELMGEDE